MSKPRKILCFGPGPMFKGGISNYNTSLAKAFDVHPENEVRILSWTQQYPAIVPREFIDKNSQVDLLKGTGIEVEYLLNYNKPSTWKETAKRILQINPDILIIQWYNAQQGLPLGRILKHLEDEFTGELIFDLHFVIQKEKSSVDMAFIKPCLKRVKNFITHSKMTSQELSTVFPGEEFNVSKLGVRSESKRNIIELFHPIYDIFEPVSTFDKARFKAENNLKEHVFLFFGFIRKYKGLHQAIRAFKLLADERDDVSFLICGESFWDTLDKKSLASKLKSAAFGVAKALLMSKKDDEKDYKPLDLIDELNLNEQTMLVNDFVANEDVYQYFQASDALVLFYERSSPSGVESIAYNFGLPILATGVGHFPETIVEGQNGYLAEAGNIEAMKEAMVKAIEQPVKKEDVKASAAHMSWQRYIDAILNFK